MVVNGFMSGEFSKEAGAHVFLINRNSGSLIDFTNSPSRTLGYPVRGLSIADIENGHTGLYVFDTGVQNPDKVADIFAYGTGFTKSLASTLELREKNSSNKEFSYPFAGNSEIAKCDKALIKSMRDYVNLPPKEQKNLANPILASFDTIGSDLKSPIDTPNVKHSVNIHIKQK